MLLRNLTNIYLTNDENFIFTEPGLGIYPLFLIYLNDQHVKAEFSFFFLLR